MNEGADFNPASFPTARGQSWFSQAYQYMRSRGLVAVIVILVGVTVFAAVAYLIYNLLSTNLRVETLLAEPIHALNNPKVVSGDSFPALKNGKEFSLSFWVYVETSVNTTGNKRVLYIGNDGPTMSPLVEVDRTSNRMYILLRTTQTSVTSSSTTILSTYATRYHGGGNAGTGAANGQNQNSSFGSPNYGNCVIMEVEYVPLNRWVNVIVSLNNDMVTLFLDGDIYSVAPVKRFASSGVVLDPTGALHVGGGNSGMSGFVSRVQMANYAFSVFHARSIYSAGPVWRLFGFLLPSNVRFQWPFTMAADDGE